MQRSTIWWVAGVLSICAALASCGTSDQSSGDASSATTSTITSPATTAATSDGSADVDVDAPADPTTTTSEAPAAALDLATALDTDRPVDGAVNDPSLLPVLEAFDDFAAERDIGAAVLAIAVDGEPVAEVALGWSDLARTEPLSVESRFRVASVTKPYTRALAVELDLQGLIDLDDQVFCTPSQPDNCLIDLTADAEAAGRPVLDEMAAITLRHLIDHTAGFDSGATFDPMFAPLLVQFDLGLADLPSESQTATWILGEPLVHTPGEVYSYSNVGYLAAGVAMEAATDQSYLELLQTHLGTADTVILGASLPSERAADEVEYACDEDTTVNLFDQNGPLTCWADGGFHLEAMTAHGRLVTPAADVLAFLAERCIDGLENLRSCDAWHDGSLPGTYAVARNFGRVDYVVLFNQRRDPDHPGGGYTDVVDTIDNAIRGALGDPFAAN